MRLACDDLDELRTWLRDREAAQDRAACRYRKFGYGITAARKCQRDRFKRWAEAVELVMMAADCDMSTASTGTNCEKHGESNRRL